MTALASFRDLELRVLHWVTCEVATPLVETLVFWTHDGWFTAFVVVLLFLLLALTKRGRARWLGVVVTAVVTLGVVHGVRAVAWKVAPRDRPGATFPDAEILRGRIAIATCERNPSMWVERSYPPRSPAMPSSHAVSVGALAIALALGGPWVGALAWLFAGCVGYGRLFLGKHWPTDVLAGFALAIAAGLLVHRYVTPRILARLRALRGPPVTPTDADTLPR